MTSAHREFMKDFIVRTGQAITIYAVSSTAYSSRYHDATITYDNGTAAYGLVVPEVTDLVKSAEGELKRAGLVMLIPYDATLANKTKITIGSTDYEVVAINNHEYQGDTIAYQVSLSRMTSS